MSHMSQREKRKRKIDDSGKTGFIDDLPRVEYWRERHGHETGTSHQDSGI